MMMSTQPTVIIVPHTLAYGGDAMGRLPDGRAIFVPFVLPGEEVRARITEEKRGYVRAELEEILQAVPKRVQPRCSHFGKCGGCHYQNMAYSEQLKAKEMILTDQLRRIGRLENPPVLPVRPSPQPFNYRNTIQFHLDALGKLGFIASGSENVFAIQECHLPEEALNQIWPQLDFETMVGLDRVGLRQGDGEDIQLILESQNAKIPEITIEGLPLSVVHLNEGEAIVVAGSKTVDMQVKERLFRVSAASFFQTNTTMAALLVDGLLDGISRYVDLRANMTVLDCYCGVGLFSAFLAPKVGRLVGVEASASAVDDFVYNLNEFDNTEIYEAPAEMALPQLTNVHPEVIVVDPPRAGLDRRVLDMILAMQPQLLAYVSCDPSTLARDAHRLMEGGYHPAEITPFDLFPQTYHIESLSFWLK